MSCGLIVLIGTLFAVFNASTIQTIEIQEERLDIKNVYAIYFDEEFKKNLAKVPEDLRRVYTYLAVTTVGIDAKVERESKNYTIFNFPLGDDCIDEAKTRCWVKYE